MKKNSLFRISISLGVRLMGSFESIEELLFNRTSPDTIRTPKGRLTSEEKITEGHFHTVKTEKHIGKNRPQL